MSENAIAITGYWYPAAGGWITAACSTAQVTTSFAPHHQRVQFRPPRRDDGKGWQFPDAPTGVREPRSPKPSAPSDGIALELPGA